MFDVHPLGVARNTNPSPTADGLLARPSFDDLGRQLTRPFQVRDLIVTAAATLSTGTKTALTTAVAGAYLDLLGISCSNDSSVAVVVTLTDESTTVRTIPIAATSVTQVNFTVPVPQSATGTAWYVDIPDITGTNVTINAEFSREI